MGTAPDYDDNNLSIYGEVRDPVQCGPLRVYGDPGDIHHYHDSSIDPDYHRKQAPHYHDNKGRPVYIANNEQHSWSDEPPLYYDYLDGPAHYYDD